MPEQQDHKVFLYLAVPCSQWKETLLQEWYTSTLRFQEVCASKLTEQPFKIDLFSLYRFSVKEIFCGSTSRLVHYPRKGRISSCMFHQFQCQTQYQGLFCQAVQRRGGVDQTNSRTVVVANAGT